MSSKGGQITCTRRSIPCHSDAQYVAAHWALHYSRYLPAKHFPATGQRLDRAAQPSTCAHPAESVLQLPTSARQQLSTGRCLRDWGAKITKKCSWGTSQAGAARSRADPAVLCARTATQKLSRCGRTAYSMGVCGNRENLHEEGPTSLYFATS